jgi:hypothetical protein
MSGRALRRTAWCMAGLSVALSIAAVVLAAVNGESPAELVDSHHAIGILTALTGPVVGALIVAGDRRNLLGWVLCVDGVLLGTFNFTEQYAPLALGLTDRHATLPGGAFASWLSAWTNIPGIVLSTVFLVLLFPDGRVPTRRWLPVAWTGAAIAVVPTAILAAGTWPKRGPELVTENASLPPAVDYMFLVAFSGALLLAAAAAVSLVLRFRRAGAVQRQQIKWFAYGAIVSKPLGAFAMAPGYGPYLELLGSALMLGGLSIGIFRYRLWEIDRLVNRTLVYGLLTAILGGCYALGVLVIGQALSPGDNPSGLAVAATTLAAAAVFRPLRGGIQRAVDRRFNRRRYDAAKTIDQFAARLRQQVDLHALTAELVMVVDQTMQPTAVTLWLRPSGARMGRPVTPPAATPPAAAR